MVMECKGSSLPLFLSMSLIFTEMKFVDPDAKKDEKEK